MVCPEHGINMELCHLFSFSCPPQAQERFCPSYPKGHKMQMKTEFITKLLTKIESTPPLPAFFPFIIKLKKKSKKISSVQIFFVILLYKRGLKHLSPQKEYRYGTKQPSFRTYSARQLLSLGSIKLSCPCSQKKNKQPLTSAQRGKETFSAFTPSLTTLSPHVVRFIQTAKRRHRPV